MLIVFQPGMTVKDNVLRQDKDTEDTTKARNKEKIFGDDLFVEQHAPT